VNTSTLIVYITIAIFAGFLIWYANRIIRRPQALHYNAAGDIAPYGTSGILDLIIFFKVAITPLGIVLKISNQLIAVEESTPEIILNSGWASFKIYYLSMLVAVQIANWLVCFSLINHYHARNATNAKLLFLVTPYFSILNFYVGQYLLGYSSPINVIFDFIPSFILSWLLFAYFTYSKRVSNTYYSDSRTEAEQLAPAQNSKQQLPITIEPGNTVPHMFETTYGARNMATVSQEEKKCPYCAEDIKFAAIKCRHCHSDLAF